MKNSGVGQIMFCDIVTQKVEPLIGRKIEDGNRSRRSTSDCTCSDNLDVTTSLAVTYTAEGSTEVAFVDKTSGAIYSADITGCFCHLVFQPPGPSKNYGE